jgi:enoyl-CoA hydratase/carnithine racemase
MYDTILVEKTEGIAKITLNRPQAMNALNPALLRELADAFEALRSDDDLDCVVITGAGRAFCAGVDIKSMDEGSAESSAKARTKLALKIIDTIENLEAPVIAAVNGYCFTGGLELALACDMIVASENAAFGDTHAKWGLTAIWGGSQRLPRVVGVMKAKELMFTCATISAREAKEIGLVNRVTPAEALEDTVMEMARSIAANSRLANRAHKQLINRGMMIDLGSALKMAEQKAPGPTRDSEERLRAFKERKKG